MRFFSSVLLLSAVLAAPVFAQYGGREGDAVIYVVTAKGSPDFVSVSKTTVNTATGFIAEDPGALPDEPFGPDFAGESRRKMHAEAGDVFNLILQREGVISPFQYLLAPIKLMVVQGLLRLSPKGEIPIDIPAGFFAPFPATVDFGPNMANVPGANVFWTNYYPNFPATMKAPADYHSPAVPPGFDSGVDYVLTLGAFAGIVPWDAMSKLYPSGGWVQGIDRKLIEDDTKLGVRTQILRLRPGRTTPMFKVSANTHLWVLNGSATVTPAGGQPTTLTNTGCIQPCSGTVYAFVPNSFAIQISNPIAYNGTTTLPAR